MQTHVYARAHKSILKSIKKRRTKYRSQQTCKERHRICCLWSNEDHTKGKINWPFWLSLPSHVSVAGIVRLLSHIYNVHKSGLVAWLKLSRILIKFVFYRYTDVVKRFCVPFPFVAVIYPVHDVIYWSKHEWWKWENQTHVLLHTLVENVADHLYMYCIYSTQPDRWKRNLNLCNGNRRQQEATGGASFFSPAFQRFAM